jgi:hypothetical protein
MTSAFSKRLRLSLALGAASLCGACSSMENIMPASLNARPGPVAAAQASHAGEPDSIVRLPLSSQDLDCPAVEVRDEGASLRVGGPENPSVRYQFDISNTARECDPVPGGNQFSLKVGVSGHLAIGPAGKPGAYTAPLRITVQDNNANKPAYSKIYTVQADTGSAAETVFRFVSDPIVLPMTRTELSSDYSITVGFDNARPAQAAHPRKRHVASNASAH